MFFAKALSLNNPESAPAFALQIRLEIGTLNTIEGAALVNCAAFIYSKRGDADAATAMYNDIRHILVISKTRESHDGACLLTHIGMQHQFHRDDLERYVTFWLDFHHFDRFELDLHEHTQVRGAAFAWRRLKLADTVLI